METVLGLFFTRKRNPSVENLNVEISLKRLAKPVFRRSTQNILKHLNFILLFSKMEYQGDWCNT